jgi:hypothetical protein
LFSFSLSHSFVFSFFFSPRKISFISLNLINLSGCILYFTSTFIHSLTHFVHSFRQAKRRRKKKKWNLFYYLPNTLHLIFLSLSPSLPSLACKDIEEKEKKIGIEMCFMPNIIDLYSLDCEIVANKILIGFSWKKKETFTKPHVYCVNIHLTRRKIKSLFVKENDISFLTR